MSQAFARFGSTVTVFEQADHVLPREDADAAAIVQARLRDDGVSLVLGAKVSAVATRDGHRVVRYTSADGEAEVDVDEILGVGRPCPQHGRARARGGRRAP